MASEEKHSFNLKIPVDDYKFIKSISEKTGIPMTKMFIVGAKREAIANKKRHAESGGDYGNR